MNTLLNGLKSATNYTLTENGGLAHKSTLYPVYDLFALGGAYRQRSDAYKQGVTGSSPVPPTITRYSVYGLVFIHSFKQKGSYSNSFL